LAFDFNDLMATQPTAFVLQATYNCRILVECLPLHAATATAAAVADAGELWRIGMMRETD